MNGLVIICWLILGLAWINPNVWLMKKHLVRWLISSGIGLVFGLLLSFLVIYFWQPALIFWMLLFIFSIMLLINIILRVWFTPDSISEGILTIIGIVAIILIVASIIVMLFFSAFYADDLYKIPNVTVAEKPAFISTEHIRVVPQQTAIWKADKKIGELGYKVEVSDPHIQWTGNKLTWLVPLEYDGGYKAWVYGDQGTEGYIKVSAEDQNAEPEKFLGYHLKYIPSAAFGYNLRRYIYFEYPDYYQKENVFQLNDKGEPVYVTMLTKPTIYLGAEKAIAIAITDPQSGEMSFYGMEQIPEWVQRVWDERLIERYLNWWGDYAHGWWNSWLGQQDVKVPTGGITLYGGGGGETTVSSSYTDLYLIRGTDNRNYWFTSISTPGKDTSMVGYIFVDVKKSPLEIKFYPVEGFFNDLGAAKNVQQDQDVSKVMGYKVSQPILYIIEGEETWIVPVLSSNDEVKEIGIVQAKGGATFVGETLPVALQEYLAYLKGTSVPAAKAQTDGKISKEQLVKEIQSLLNQAQEKLTQLEKA